MSEEAAGWKSGTAATAAAGVGGGLDWKQAGTLLGMTLRQSFRANVDPATSKKSQPLRVWVVSLLVLGLVFMSTAGRCANFREFMVLLFVFVFAMAMFGIIPDTHDVRQKEIEILHCRPIAAKTLAVSNAFSLLMLAWLTTTFFSIAPFLKAVARFHCPPLAGIGLYLSMVAGTFSLVVLWLTLLTIASQRYGINRLRMFSQTLFFVVLLVQMGVSLSFLPALNLGKGGVLSGNAIRFVPSTWFVDLCIGGGGPAANLERAAAVLLVFAALLVVLRLNLHRHYPRMAEKMLEAPTERASAPYDVRFLSWIRKALPAQAYGVATLILTVDAREEAMRFRVIAARLPVVVLFLVSVATGWDASYFVAIFALSNLLDGVNSSRQCSQSEASSLFESSPIGARALLLGTQLSVLLRNFLWGWILGSILFFLHHPPALAIAMTFAYLLEAYLIVCLLVSYNPTLPLSVNLKASQSVGNIVYSFFFTGLTAIVQFAVAGLLTSAFPRVATTAAVMAGLVALVVAMDHRAIRRLTYSRWVQRPVPRRRRWLRRIAWTAATVAALLILLVCYLLFVPPPGRDPVVPSAGLQTVAASENSWPDYTAALGPINPADTTYYRKAAAAYAFLQNPADVAAMRPVVDQQSAALDCIQRGVRKPACSVTGTLDYQVLFRVRELTGIVLAKARISQVDGLQANAADWYLAACRFETDMTDVSLQQGTWIMERGYAPRLIIGWMSSNAGGADFGQVAGRLHACYAATPSPSVAARWFMAGERRRSQENSFYGTLFKPFPGLRKRLERRQDRQSAQLYAAVTPYLDTWNFKELKRVNDRYMREAVAPWIGSFMPFDQIVRMLYIRHTDLLAAESFAAILAYNSAHGQLPASLEQAAVELALDAPVDPVTGKTAGYRIEDGKPVVWFAGFDGQDSGGNTPCPEPWEASGYGKAIAGDFVYRFQDIASHPAVLPEAAAEAD